MIFNEYVSTIDDFYIVNPYFISCILSLLQNYSPKHVIFDESLNMLWDKLAAGEISPVVFLQRITKFKLIKENNHFATYLSRIDLL